VYAGMHCRVRSFARSSCPLTPNHATLPVPFFPHDAIDDLTFAILYKHAVQSYYPLALLLWREKIRQLLR